MTTQEQFPNAAVVNLPGGWCVRYERAIGDVIFYGPYSRQAKAKEMLTKLRKTTPSKSVFVLTARFGDRWTRLGTFATRPAAVRAQKAQPKDRITIVAECWTQQD